MNPTYPMHGTVFIRVPDTSEQQFKKKYGRITAITQRGDSYEYELTFPDGEIGVYPQHALDSDNT